MNCLRIALAALAVVAAMRSGGRADAAEIKVLASGSLKGALSQLVPDFQKASGHRATIEYGPAGAIVGRIQQDDAADVVIVSRSQIEKLASNGRVLQGSLVNVAGIALGVAVRKGAPRPDISSVEAFKRALLSARSIGYRDPATGSTSGTYAASLLERLGMTEDLKPKLNSIEPRAMFLRTSSWRLRGAKLKCRSGRSPRSSSRPVSILRVRFRARFRAPP